MAGKQTIILTITCPDTVGIVAAVSGFLSEHDAFITEAAQYGDPIRQAVLHAMRLHPPARCRRPRGNWRSGSR